MIKKILIANRGEVASRIVRTAKKMNIKTVAVYSEADINSLYVKQADEAIFIGPSPVMQSYLNQKNIIKAIELSGANAVHPGYGLLAENAEFVSALKRRGIIFIGPSTEAINKMGDKIEAKKIAQKAKVNIIPGYAGVIKNAKEALKLAKKIGYPIMIKAAAGGGGIGMRIARSPQEMEQAFLSAQNEAKNSFADGRIFLEKYIENPRHIEIQILGDKHGNWVCLGERECSIQRRHQKIIEETPSIFIDDKTRQKMYKQSVALAKAVNYHSAGTIEFIVDKNRKFYFLEMNTRLQVEHPITELVTGVDLVEQMIFIAQNQKLDIRQEDVRLKGWAMEARICAEDPAAGFLPSTGRINFYQEPDESKNIRIDTGIYEGGEVSMFYDSMLAKLCTYAPTRKECIDVMNNALSSYIIRGISHNIGFLETIFHSPRFIQGDISTHFIEEEYKEGFTGSELGNEGNAVVLSAACFAFLESIRRNAAITPQMRKQQRMVGTRWVIFLDNTQYPVIVRPIDDRGYKVVFEDRKMYITSNWVLGAKLFQCTINHKEYNLQVEMAGSGMYLTFKGSKYYAKILSPRAAELNKFMPMK